MYNINQTEAFNLSVALIVDVLKLHNKAIVESCQKTFIALFGSEYTTDILTVAVFELAETDPDTCHWTLQNLSELEACHNLLEGSIKFAVNKLIGTGFILGKDFSTTCTGEILIDQKAKAALLKNVPSLDRILIEEILRSD